MRFRRPLSACLATAVAIVALALAPRAHTADAPPTPSAPIPTPVTNALTADLQTNSPTNSLPLPGLNERGDIPGPASSPDTNTNAPATPLPTNALPTGVAPTLTNRIPRPPASNSVPTSPSTTTLGPSLPARETKTPSPPTPRIDFSTFKILTERNIFDPNRSSRSSRSGTPSSTNTPPPSRPPTPTYVETFTLVGTLAFGENQMAFVDGPSSQYKRALRLNDTIAGLRLKSVAANDAAFDNDGKEISLRIGHQLRREDRREWRVNTQPTPYASAPPASTSTNNPSSTSTATPANPSTTTTAPTPGSAPAVVKPEPAPTAADAEALRRLLEKRRKEEER